MSTSTRPSVLVAPALALLCLVTGCQGSSAAAEEAVPSSSAALRAGEAQVNGLAAEQEVEAVARIAAEAEAARLAAEAEALRVAAEAEAARVAEEQAAQDAVVPRTAVAAGAATPQAAPRNPTGPAQAPAPQAPAPTAPSGDLVLSGMACHNDGTDFILGFTATFGSGHHYMTLDNYRTAGPFISRLNGHHVLRGNFMGYGNCVD